MVELVVFGVVLFAAVAVFGVAIGLLGLVGTLVMLPLRILGWTFKALGLVLALPFVLLAVAIGGAVAVLFAGVALLPALPFVAVIYVLYRLLRGRGADARSRASVA